MIIFVD